MAERRGPRTPDRAIRDSDRRATPRAGTPWRELAAWTFALAAVLAALGLWLLRPEPAGAQPQWSGDGRQIFYFALDRKLMQVPIEIRDGELFAGVPKPLFQTHVVAPRFAFSRYDVTRDATRFVVNSLKPEAPLTIVSNWPALLQR